jgi:diguanylate cyclase (GGDEF)-like protein
MDEAAAQVSAAPSREPRAGVGLRLAVALAACALAGIVAERLLGTVIDAGPMRVLLSAGGSAAMVGLFLQRQVLSPLARSRADLHDRYQAALADSLRDPLTRLGNHRAFQEELDRQVEASHRYDVPLSLVLIDLDGFKEVNDSMGHGIGDQTLARFGEMVNGSIRRADRPFRIGGDEFALVLPHTDPEGARIVARRLLATTLSPPLRGTDPRLSAISFSAGVSSIPFPAGTRAQLYSQADSALYAAKRAGRTGVVVFDPTTETSSERRDSGAAVADVIARNLLKPVYQPIVDLASGTVLGVEGLIRPVEPAPFADPAALFAAAEASGHLVALDLTCVETIVAGAVDLASESFLTVNLTPATLESPEFSAASLLSILARYGFPPDRLVIELTEGQPLADVQRAKVKLDACRSTGMRLAADDVGAGNAGLRLLSELRFDIIKVDLTLIQRSASSASSSAVVESVVALAARTGARVVGEGIERPEQIEQLRALGVTLGQGFLLGRPGALPRRAREMLPDRPVPAAAPPVQSGGAMAEWRQSLGLPVT